MNVRIADRLCGQGERGWQVRTQSSGDCCALFPPSWLSSMIKEKILVIPAVVHVLKLFGMLMSKPTSSSWHVVYLLGVSLQHVLLNTCVEEMQTALVKTGSHKSSWLLLCNGNQIVAQLVLLWNCSLFWGTLASLSRSSEASLSSSFSVESCMLSAFRSDMHCEIQDMLLRPAVLNLAAWSLTQGRRVWGCKQMAWFIFFFFF